MNMVHNERTKLLANALDRASSACLTVGFLAPVAAAYYGPLGSMPQAGVLISGCAAWIVAALTLHYGASATLKDLR
jgi:hypothetical protein